MPRVGGRRGTAKLHIIAASMNAYIGALLAQRYGRDVVRSLLLVSPAAYAYGAEFAPLGDEFRSIIRDFERDPLTSSIFQALREYDGPVLVAYGAEDIIIPDPVQVEFRMHSQRSICVTGLGHKLLSDTDDPRVIGVYTEWADLVQCMSSAPRLSRG